MASLAKKLEYLIPGAPMLSINDWGLLKAVLGTVAETERLPTDWWQKNDAELADLAQLFASAADRRSEQDELTQAIQEVITGAAKDLTVLLAPVDDHFKAWHSFLRPGYWHWRKQVQANLCPGNKFTREGAKSLSAQCRRALEIECWFGEHSTRILPYLESGVRQTAEVLRGVSQSFTAASLRKRGLAAVGKESPPALSMSAEGRKAAKEILDQISNADVLAALDQLNSDWPAGFIGEAVACHSPLPEVAARALTLITSMPRVRERVLLNRALQHCASRGSSSFVESFGAVSRADAPRIFERRFLKLWLTSAIDRSQALSGFTESKGNDLLEKYRNLDGRVRRLAVGRAQMTASAASARVRAAEEIPENASEVGILRRELQKRKRIKPLRKLFAEIPHVLQALKPCLLMSPISVSTYLKPDVFQF